MNFVSGAAQLEHKKGRLCPIILPKYDAKSIKINYYNNFKTGFKLKREG